MSRTTSLLALFVAVAVAGCNHESGTDAGTDAGTCATAAQYPCGPFGYSAPNAIADLHLFGHQDDASGKPTEAAHDIHFHDYFHTQAKVLVILVAAGWCGPCKTEQPSLITLYNNYQASNPGQVAMVEAITQNNNSAIATMVDVDTWASSYKDPFTMASDPENLLSAYLGSTTFPGQMVIRTSDMTIQWTHNGLAGTDLKTQIDLVLSGS